MFSIGKKIYFHLFIDFFSGFSHTAYLFGNESNVYTAQFDPTRVPKGALVKILQKGVFFAEAERFALLGGDAVDKYEKTAGTVSLLESGESFLI